MRFAILLLLALGAITGGITAFAGAVSMQSRGVAQDDIYAALVIGGMLSVIGILLVVLAFRVRRTVKQRKAELDAGQTSAVVTGMMLGSDLGDDFSDDPVGD
ncbi:MAG: hypothetical protein P8J20_19040 [Novosphingobium sp.]|nr:hypothetical protein [Novosphingobium sp.]